MTFSDSLTHLNVLQGIGLTSIKPITFKKQTIVPLEFLKSFLPNPADISQNYKGKTCIGCMITGVKDGIKTKLIYNICHHQDCHNEVRPSCFIYNEVPAMIGAKLILNGQWRGEGVFNMEQFDAKPFMDELNKQGLPWKVIDCDKNIA